MARRRDDEEHDPDEMWFDGMVGGCRLIPSGDHYIAEQYGICVHLDASALLRVPLVDFGERVEEGILVHHRNLRGIDCKTIC